ncbi:hypothetical protein GGR56DRAFT_686835 [Xylariaceae sp. FL0804]|nr:hypothetical protein GGR56DRAFT_686835 [Xylariaceae sp. FL0804]
MYQVSVALALCAAAYAAAFNVESLFAGKVSAGTLIAFSNNSDYAIILSPKWFTWEAPSFVAAIKPVTESDIQTINNLSFLATNNGHRTGLGYGDIQDTLNINLANFNSVSVNTSANTLTISGGVKFSDLLGPVRIITAASELLVAFETENADLFWAVQGAGANFGIITKATYTVYEQVNGGNAVLASFSFPASANISGTRAAAQEYLEVFQNLDPSALSIKTVTAAELYTTLSVGDYDSGRINTYTLGLNHTDMDTFTKVFDTMVDFYASYTDYSGVLIYQWYNNTKALEVSESATAYPWRNTKTYI